jgi:hypothetical protein
MSVRKNMAQGVQGATNLANNQLGQDMMKLAQEYEGLGTAARVSKTKAKKSRQSKHLAGTALATDVAMAE